MFFDRFCIFATSLCILPACAGINPINFLFFSLAGYSPRMRGGQPSFMATLDRPEEFSPHARGSTSFDARGKHTFDILPACAGSTLRGACAPRGAMAFTPHRMRGVNPEGGVRTTRRDGIHPACAGVNPALSSSHGSKKGFSLHARGSTRRKSFAVNILTILPARAGVNPYLFAFLVPDADSPHMRGGQPAWEYCFATCE